MHSYTSSIPIPKVRGFIAYFQKYYIVTECYPFRTIDPHIFDWSNELNNWRYFIPFFLWLSILSSGNSIASEKTIPLKTAVFDGCPFICLDGTGAFLDVLRLALKDTNYRLEFMDLPYNRAKKLVANGSIDLLPGSLKNSIEGAFYPNSWMFFTQMCFFVGHNDTWIYDGFKSLNNRKLLVENGIIYTPEFFEHIKTLDNVQSISGEQILKRQHQMLINKRIDTFLAEQTILKSYNSNNNNSTSHLAFSFYFVLIH